MRIWIIDHYSVPVQYYPLARNTNFAKNLMNMGHEVIIFAASTVHNSDINLIEGKEQYKEVLDDGVKYVLVKCHQYSGNGIKRILNMMEFSRKLGNVCDKYEKPDAIVSTSMTLHACRKGIQIGKKYRCKKIAQITDLWPETLIAYGLATKNHPLVLWFRKIEKWIYKNADQIVFSMEGAYDYIKEQGWENDIPESRVHYINNGVDLAEFNANRENWRIEDTDLKNPDLFKVIYTGSIRKVNHLSTLLDAAKLVENRQIRFLIWGDGDELPALKQRVENEHIDNVAFKGRVEKKYIPYIVSNADLNVAHNTASPMFRFGISFNKIFDYFAAGKPILCDFPCKYNPVIQCEAGVALDNGSEKDIAEVIDRFAVMDQNQYGGYCANALKAADKYDFGFLTEQLVNVVELI